MRPILSDFWPFAWPRRSNARVFGAIYAGKSWGGDDHDFYSGSGSHLPSSIEPYVSAVRKYLASLPAPPVVVDVGCGDLAAARQWLDLTAHYHGCDVVAALIERNRRLVASPRVSFHVVDAAAAPLPHGDVVVVKQVFQHLSNEDIQAIITRLSAYRRWIITEHVPRDRFVPNRDMRTSGYTRLRHGSGVVLTEPPFAIAPARNTTLCEIMEQGHPVRTIAYEFD